MIVTKLKLPSRVKIREIAEKHKLGDSYNIPSLINELTGYWHKDNPSEYGRFYGKCYGTLFRDRVNKSSLKTYHKYKDLKKEQRSYYCRKYYEQNASKIIASNRRYLEENPEALIRQKQKQKDWRAKNPEKIKEYTENYKSQARINNRKCKQRKRDKLEFANMFKKSV